MKSHLNEITLIRQRVREQAYEPEHTKHELARLAFIIGDIIGESLNQRDHFIFYNYILDYYWPIDL